MAKSSTRLAQILHVLESTIMNGSEVELREVTLKNGKKYSFNPTALIAVEERNNNQSKIILAGAGNQLLSTPYDDVFTAPIKTFEEAP